MSGAVPSPEEVIDLCDDDDKDPSDNEVKADTRLENRRKRQHSGTAAAADAVDLCGAAGSASAADNHQAATDADARYRQKLGPLRFDFCESFLVHSYDEKNKTATTRKQGGGYTPLPSASLLSKKKAASKSGKTGTASAVAASASKTTSIAARVGGSASRSRKRLYRELLEYQLNLPVHDTSSIFVRGCENQVSLVRALLTGPSDTPYANGCFLFDLLVDTNTYPAQPPKVHFLTTANGRVRFNPNLYNCGKVCLSLLGTWSGPAWQPNQSTLLQVLVSIQALIFVDHPYFNEPCYANMKGQKAADRASAAYNRNLRKNTLEHAVNAYLKSILATAVKNGHEITFDPTLPILPAVATAAATTTAAAASRKKTVVTTKTASSKKKSPTKSSNRKHSPSAATAAAAAALEAAKAEAASAAAATSASNATFLHDSYPELERVVQLHFCERAAALEEQLDAWIKLDGDAIRTVAQDVRRNLRAVVALNEQGKLWPDDEEDSKKPAASKAAPGEPAQKKQTPSKVIAID